MTIRQSDLARELQVSEMTVHRALKALGRNGQPLTDADCLAVLTIAELQNLGFAWHVASDLLKEFVAEIRHLAESRSHRCWITFVDTDDASLRLASTTEQDFIALVDDLPISLTLPLHQITAKASDRLASVRARKEAS